MQAPTADSWSPDDHLRHHAYRAVADAFRAHFAPGGEAQRRLWAGGRCRALDFGAEWYGDPDGGWQTYARGILKAAASPHRVEHVLATHPPHDVQAMPEYADESFDVAVVDNVLEHVERPWLAEAELRRVLAPGGACVAVTPGMYPDHKSPLDCWRIMPDGYRALFPAARWRTLALGAWGSQEQLEWELKYNGAFPDGPPETTVAQARERSPAFDAPYDGRFPLMVWWVGERL